MQELIIHPECDHITVVNLAYIICLKDVISR